MSELRQRKGEADQATKEAKDEEIAKLRAELEATKKNSAELNDDDKAKRFLEEVNQALEQNKPGAVKGLSNQAKKFKVALDNDPMNMECIFQLGVAYAMDQQWDKAINVLMRGWKRVKEFEDRNVRAEFLICLAQASEKEEKYKQALAVMNDIEDVDDDEMQRNLESLRCRVYCQNGDTQRGLDCINKEVDGLEFDKQALIWANLISPLKRAGAYDISKSKMMALAKTDKNKDTLECMEKLVAYRDVYYAAAKPQPLNSGRKTIIGAAIFVSVVLFLLMLYFMEAASLKKLQLTNK